MHKRHCNFAVRHKFRTWCHLCLVSLYVLMITEVKRLGRRNGKKTCFEPGQWKVLQLYLVLLYISNTQKSEKSKIVAYINNKQDLKENSYCYFGSGKNSGCHFSFLFSLWLFPADFFIAPWRPPILMLIFLFVAFCSPHPMLVCKLTACTAFWSVSLLCWFVE